MNVENLFPIGTVVLLNEGTKKLMIIGILQESQGKRYDYMGVTYPEGFMGPEYMFLFNQEDIQNVFYLGFMDSEYQIFRANLVKHIEGEQVL